MGINQVYDLVSTGPEFWAIDRFEGIIRISQDGKLIDHYDLPNNAVTSLQGFTSETKEYFVFGLINKGDYNQLYIAYFDSLSNEFKELPLDNDLQINQDSYVFSNIVEDAKGAYWLITNDMLVRINLIEGYVEEVPLSINIESYQTIEPASQSIVFHLNKLWFMGYLSSDSTGNSFDHYILMSFDPSIEEIQFYGSPPGLENLGPLSGTPPILRLFVDGTNRIWVTDFGWLDISEGSKNVWHQIIRPPEFVITTSKYAPYEYLWASGIPVFSSEQSLLMNISKGIVKLDMESEEWCIVSRGETGPLEIDPENNVYVITNDELYVLP